MLRNFQEYEARNQILASLGFPSYKDYLQSELWSRIRGQILDRDNRTCDACKRPASHVHHRKYTLENLSGKSLGWMVSLCPRCHHNAEFNAKYGKVSLAKANSRLKTIRRRQARDYCWHNMPEFRSLWRQLKDAKRRGTPFRADRVREIRKKMAKLIKIAKNRTAGSENPATQPIPRNSKNSPAGKPEGQITR